MTHDFHETVRKGGPISAWVGGKTVNYVAENGTECWFCFTDGTIARFEWVDDNGEPLKGKLRVKSAGKHVVIAQEGLRACR